MKGSQVSSELRVPSVLHSMWYTMAYKDLNDLWSFLMAEMFSPILMVEEGEGMGVKFQALCVLTWFS